MSNPSSWGRESTAGRLRFERPYFLAGMAGYGDRAFRVLVRELGCPYCVTEATDAAVVLRGGRALRRARALPADGSDPHADAPLALQLIGGHPDEMAAAAARLAEGHAVVDVNLACPQKKARGFVMRGGNLLAAPERAIAVLRAVRAAVPPSVPTTAKLRLGSDGSAAARRRFDAIFDAVYEGGYAWATVHGRTVEQRYRGAADWRRIGELARRCGNRPLLGSGDLHDAATACRRLDESGVAAVALARGAVNDPWIFRRVEATLTGAAEPSATPWSVLILRYAELVKELLAEAEALPRARRLALTWLRERPGAARLRRHVLEATRAEQLAAVFETAGGPGPTVAPSPFPKSGRGA